ncbi:Beta-galactosidase 8 [Diplonema papillatum]|nr:Beta-galactosidase 8 [Diplonema papillatum]
MKCDGSDFSAGVHPRYAFALPADKDEYSLQWAVGVKDDAAGMALPGLQPAGFQIKVSEANGNALWDSGIVRSSDLSYKLSAATMGTAFSKLRSGKTYRWDLTWVVESERIDADRTLVQSEEGLVFSPVGSARFHLALAAVDWDGTYWIGSNETNVYKGTFTTPPALSSAMLYICALGFSEAYINDKPLSDPAPALTLTPWSANDFLNSFSTFDVSSLLLPVGNENNITVHLGHGWRSLKKLDPANSVGDYTERVLRLLLRADNGSSSFDLLKSDAASGKWQTTASQVVYDNLYNGATYDSRVELSWQPVKTNIPPLEGPLGEMTPWIGPAVHFNREVTPVSVTEPQKGIFVLDFGVNLAGVVRMNNVSKFAALVPNGQNITLRHGELLQHNDLGSPVQPGMVYTANLRTAMATDTFIFGGSHQHSTWQPKHTYRGFRYLEVSGWSTSPDGIAAGFSVDVSDFTMLHHHTSLKQTMTANFSNAMLNSMQLGAMGSQRSNSQTVQTDCDQRDERLGWLADMGFTSGSMALNYDTHQYFHRLLQNINSNVDPKDGSIPDNTPFVRYGTRPAEPTWSLAFPLLAYETWKTYNDTTVVTTYLDSLVRNQGNVAMQANQSGICNMSSRFADWMPAPTIPGNNFSRLQASGPFVTVISYMLNTYYILEMAKAVGNATVVASMDSQMAMLKHSLQQCFWHNTTNTFDVDVQANYDLAGIIDVMTDGGLPQSEQIKARLTALLELWGGNNYGGIAATRYLFHYLDSVGMASTAQDIMMKDSYPSFGFMATHPLEPLRENMWELMDSYHQGPGMNSRNNLMWTSFSLYLVTKMAGIDWRDRRLHAPSLDLAITRFHGASTVYESHHGNISFAWEYLGGAQRFSLYPTIERDTRLKLFCGSVHLSSEITGKAAMIEKVTKLALLSHGRPVEVLTSELDGVCVGKSACIWDLSTFRDFMVERNVTEVRAEILCSEPLSAALKRRKERGRTMDVRPLAVCLLLAGCRAAFVGMDGVSVTMDQAGGYEVQLDGESWMQSPPGGGSAQLWGAELKQGTWTEVSGSDPTWGGYKGAACSWTAGSASVKTTIMVLSSKPGVVFRQEYLAQATRPGSVVGDMDRVAFGFPQFVVGGAQNATGAKNMLFWGENQLAGSNVSLWSPPFYGGVQGGLCLVFNQTLRATMVGPTRNFITSIHSNLQNGNVFTAGVASSVGVIPQGYIHETLLLAGQGINSTATKWGAALLEKNAKPRTPSDADFVVSHLGYWTDHGAYYYRSHTGFGNPEEALLAVKKSANASGIPLHYFQWDDWWFYQSNGPEGADWGGMLIWQPKPELFPSGMTDWLGSPLSLYVDAYSPQNIYINDSRYKWAIDDTNHSVPVTRAFFDDMFRNGTQIGMKMFEQDFLSYHQSHSHLLINDTTTGDSWLDSMGVAAAAANITLQWCMMYPNHVLKTTEVPSVTNGRASQDGVGAPRRHLVLGYSCMLLHIVGLWCSADNAWSNTTLAPTRDPDPTSDVLIAALVAGPYGVADSYQSFNKSLIMQTTRSDGILLKPDRPVTAMDLGFVLGFSNNTRVPHPYYLWSTHTDVSDARFSYLLAINSESPINIAAADLDDRDPSGTKSYVAYNYFNPTASAVWFGGGAPTSSFTFPAAPAPKNQTVQALGYGYWVTAPVLLNDWVFLGEGKFIAASVNRVVSFAAATDSLEVVVKVARGEVYAFMYILPASLKSQPPSVQSGECASTICASSDECTVTVMIQNGAAACSISEKPLHSF